MFLIEQIRYQHEIIIMIMIMILIDDHYPALFLPKMDTITKSGFLSWFKQPNSVS